MKTSILAFSAILVLGTSSLCARDDAQRRSPTKDVRRYAKIHGTLYWFGQKFPGATIFLEGDGIEKSMKTDANGAYEFKVPPGRYAITAPGMWASEPFRTEIITVDGGDVEQIDFWFW